MFGNKLIQHLTTFSRKEMTRFLEFSASPYHNKHQKTHQLIIYLSAIYPLYTEKNCNRQRIFKKLFPNKPFQQSELALVFTYAFRLLEQFLIQEQFAHKKILAQVFLLQHLRQRKQYKQYNRTLLSLEKTVEKHKYKDSNFYHLQFISAMEADIYYAQRTRHQKDLRIQSKQDNLDYFFLSQKLRDACEMLVRSKILKVNYSTGFLSACLEEITNNRKRYEHIPAILIYYRIYKMLELQDTSHYQPLLTLIAANEHQFSKSELLDIYNYLQHFSIEELNRGNMAFLKAYFNIYRLQLEKEMLFENGFLSQWHYKNIVSAAVRLKEHDWGYQFIEQYKSKLAPENRENAYRFNLASYYYAIQDYDKVLQYLLDVEYNDGRYIQGVKALLLRTYFDLEAETALYSLIDSFRQYIKREKNLSDNRKAGFSNLLKFTKRTFVLKTQAKYMNTEKYDKTLRKLKTDIEATHPIFNQTWLLAQINQLSLN